MRFFGEGNFVLDQDQIPHEAEFDAVATNIHQRRGDGPGWFLLSHSACQNGACWQLTNVGDELRWGS